MQKILNTILELLLIVIKILLKIFNKLKELIEDYKARNNYKNITNGSTLNDEDIIYEETVGKESTINWKTKFNR